MSISERIPCICMLSHFSHVWLFATPWTVAQQASQSIGFFSQEYWSGLTFPSTFNVWWSLKPMRILVTYFCLCGLWLRVTGDLFGKNQGNYDQTLIINFPYTVSNLTTLKKWKIRQQRIQKKIICKQCLQTGQQDGQLCVSLPIVGLSEQKCNLI